MEEGHGGTPQVRGIDLQLNSIQSQYSRKCNNQPAFFLSPKTLHCQELVEEDVLHCSSKVCKLADIQGGECCDNWKSHHSGRFGSVCQIICAIKNGRGNLHHTLGHYCTALYCATYVIVWSAIFLGCYWGKSIYDQLNTSNLCQQINLTPPMLCHGML
jgi:hypothetical protein